MQYLSLLCESDYIVITCGLGNLSHAMNSSQARIRTFHTNKHMLGVQNVVRVKGPLL